MKLIYIIVPQGEVILSSLVGTYKILLAANEHLQLAGKEPLFQVRLAGLPGSVQLYGGMFSIQPDTTIDTISHADLIIIPAVQPTSLPQNQAFIPWLIKLHQSGAEIASLCVGAFLLAATGLLDGKKCATHWVAADAFRQMYPNVHLQPEKIITDEKGFYTSGGAFSFLNLILYLVEKHCGQETALYLSKLFEIDIQRNSQSPFIMFHGQKSHEDEPIKQAQLFMEQHLSEKISVPDLARRFAISRRHFERRFKTATANTPAEYLQRVKIEAAKKNLETGNHNVSQAMDAVGYTDQKAFRTAFKKITGLSPADYQKRYRRAMATK